MNYVMIFSYFYKIHQKKLITIQFLFIQSKYFAKILLKFPPKWNPSNKAQVTFSKGINIFIRTTNHPNLHNSCVKKMSKNRSFAYECPSKSFPNTLFEIIKRILNEKWRLIDQRRILLLFFSKKVKRSSNWQ